jgi:hypothetical protein
VADSLIKLPVIPGYERGIEGCPKEKAGSGGVEDFFSHKSKLISAELIDNSGQGESCEVPGLADDPILIQGVGLGIIEDDANSGRIDSPIGIG